MKKIITHNDRFHADDVFSIATLNIIFNGEIEVIRTRDKEIIDSGDIVLDVGDIYDPSKNRYDHHMPEGAGKRENEIPYASFGLIWKHFGKDFCDNEKVWEKVDKNLVQPIDAGDNGFSISTSTVEDVREFSMGAFVGIFNPTWKEESSLYDENFFKVVDMAKQIIEREIKKAKDSVSGNELVEKIYEETEDKRFIVLDDIYPWHDFIKDKKEVLFVLSPSKLGDKWRVTAVQEEGFKNRKDLPESWSGKRDEELQEISGVEDAIFCHRNLFTAYTASKEGALEMVKIALE